MDGVTSLQVGEVATFVKVPQHCHAVLSSGRAQGSIGGDGDGVDVSGVSHQVGAQLAVVQVPDLHQLVPASGNNQRSVQVGGETHARDPLLKKQSKKQTQNQPT